MHHLLEIAQRQSLPERGAYETLITEVMQVLRSEDPLYRPRDEKDRPGGLLRLDERTTVIVPDLHGRMQFLIQVLAYQLEGKTIGELLRDGSVQVICVGDGFHAEARAAERWKQAFKEFAGKYRHHAAMDEEMRESLGLMEMVMHLKIDHPASFHFLKGNHENILNEDGNGNRPFRKFAYEGEMVKEWVLHFYGEDFIAAYATFEHELPLLAADKTFMVSHAEPQRFFTREEVIRYREYDDVVYGLTWTPNDGAEEGSVEQMLGEYCSKPMNARYFGGHRPVQGEYSLRADGRYIQLHNPSTYSIAVVQPGEVPDPQQCIVVLPEDGEAGSQAAENW
jgi:hypothetical protein